MDFINEAAPLEHQRVDSGETILLNENAPCSVPFDWKKQTKSDFAEIANLILAVVYVAGFCTIYYYLWAFFYEVVEDAWEMKIAASPLTVGALFVVACLYFWLQVALYKVGKWFQTGREVGQYFMWLMGVMYRIVFERE